MASHWCPGEYCVGDTIHTTAKSGDFAGRGSNMLSGGEYQVFISDVVRNQNFIDAIIDVTSTYKKW